MCVFAIRTTSDLAPQNDRLVRYCAITKRPHFQDSATKMAHTEAKALNTCCFEKRFPTNHKTCHSLSSRRYPVLELFVAKYRAALEPTDSHSFLFCSTNGNQLTTSNLYVLMSLGDGDSSVSFH
jgi:hypothetical protein